MAQTKIRSGQIDTGTTDGKMAIVEAGDTLNASVIPSGAGGNQVGIMSGSVANGGTIPLPSGFTQAQCKWTVSHRGPVSDTNGGWDGMNCTANASRVVSSYHGDENTGSNTAVTANYLIIGVI